MSLPNMQDFAWKLNLSTNNFDIYNQFQKNNLEVIKSKIDIRLSTFKGEWGPDPDFGISAILIQDNQTNPDVLVQIISDEILKTENVNSVAVNSTEFNASSRLMSVSYDVNTLYGITTVTKVF